MVALPPPVSATVTVMLPPLAFNAPVLLKLPELMVSPTCAVRRWILQFFVRSCESDQ
jgi:hypothetical protein